MTEKNRTEKGVLYLVATPIGNLADISERAKKVLAEVDFIAAEDTRNSGKLLACFGISKPFVSYFEHNKAEHGPLIASRIEAGESCALVTDAGMPAISDPGEDLVRLCADRGIPVLIVPGCCAAVSALALSGLSTARFAFEGFLSTERSVRRAHLDSLKGDAHTLIFYEAPHKLRTTLADLYDAFGDRAIALCRELTKINEDVMRTTLSGAIAYYETNEPRGEYVLVLAGADPRNTPDGDANFENMTVEEHVAFYEQEGFSRMDAIKAVAKDRGVSKGVIYKQLLK